MAKKLEKTFHQEICNFMDIKYPHVIYSVDPAGIRLSVGLASEVKRKRCKNWKTLDMPIYFPNKKYHGLFLELKKEIPYLNNGNLSADKTIQEQQKTIEEFLRIGYFATFVWTLQQAKNYINEYMKDAL
jgi:hypothetical protein